MTEPIESTSPLDRLFRRLYLCPEFMRLPGIRTQATHDEDNRLYAEALEELKAMRAEREAIKKDLEEIAQLASSEYADLYQVTEDIYAVIRRMP